MILRHAMLNLQKLGGKTTPVEWTYRMVLCMISRHASKTVREVHSTIVISTQVERKFHGRTQSWSLLIHSKSLGHKAK